MSAKITKGDKVLVPRGRKPYTVTGVNEDGTLVLRRRTAERAYKATARRYRGIGGQSGVEYLWAVDSSTVTLVEKEA